MTKLFSGKNLDHQQDLLNSNCNLSITISVTHLGLLHTYFKFLWSSELPVTSFCLFSFADRVTSPPYQFARFVILLQCTEILQQ